MTNRNWTKPIDKPNAQLVSWALVNGDTAGDGITADSWGDRNVQVVGSFDGASVSIQGSNDNATWVTLNDVLGNPLTFSAEGMRQILETPFYTRPIASGGGSSMDLQVLIFARRTQR